MAFITRCPYCGAVWRIPDKDTAEVGPVRCSACRHSFDATVALLCVDEAMFPDLPPCTLPKASRRPAAAKPQPERPGGTPKAGSEAADAASFAPAQLRAKKIAPAAAPAAVEPEPAVPEPPVQPAPAAGPEAPAPFQPESGPAGQTGVSEPSAPQPEPAQPVPAPAAPVLQETVPQEAVEAPAAPEPAATVPVQTPEASAPAAAEARPDHKTEPTVPDTDLAAGLVHVQRPGEAGGGRHGRTEPALHIQRLAPKQEPHLGPGPAPGVRPEAAAPTLAGIVPDPASAPGVEVVVSEPGASYDLDERRPHSWTGFIVVLAALVLLATLAAVTAVVFNQKLITMFPQTQELFTEVCGRVPCPGFYLSDPNAFTVTKTTLRPVDESGNYSLDVTLINNSKFAQAVPWLELELLDDNNDSLMKRTLTPYDYLSDPQTTRSIAPNRSLTVRVSLQTNVTSARCVVKPIFPQKQ